ncbi:Major Facilitator Superfamily protein [Brugia pahangi]
MAKSDEQNVIMMGAINQNANDLSGTTSNSSSRIRGIRYIILVSTLLCLASIMSNIVTFNFTVLCISPQYGKELSHANQSARNASHEGYSKDDRTIIFSSTAVGALLTVIFVTQALQYFGLRIIFFVSGMLTAITTMLVPLAVAQNGIVYFVILRVCQGISFTICMPTTGAVTSTWASLKQNGLFISTLSSFSQLAAVFTMATSGKLCTSSFGWPAVYYLHAGISFIAFAVWVLLYRNQPAEHPLVNEIELEEINRGRSTATMLSAAKKHQKIPYLAILATPAIWGIWAAAIGDLMTLQLIHTFSPQYIREILGYSVEHTGFSAALPVLVQFLFKIFAGYSSDKLHILSETAKLRLYNSIALGISAFFLIILAFLPQGYPLTGVILLTLATSMYGFNGAGFNKCATLVSRQYSAFVLGHIQILWCIAMLLSPILVNALIGEGTIYDWRFIFLLHAFFSLITNVYFCFVAASDAAWWTDDERVKACMRSGDSFWWWKGEPQKI